MLSTQLQEIFKKGFDSGDFTEVFGKHFASGKVEYTVFKQGQNAIIPEEPFKQRFDSIIAAVKELYAINETKLPENFNSTVANYHKNIQKVINESNSKSLKEKVKAFEVFLAKTVYVNLATEYYGKKVRYKSKDYYKFLELLRAQEIETLGKKPRPIFINFDEEDGYFTAEIPLGIDVDDGKPYTQQSYKRNNGRQSNFVLHIIGHRNKTGEVQILDTSTRAANFVPIDLNNNIMMLCLTLQQVKQRHDAVKELSPATKRYLQLSLLSPIHRAASALDEQQGYKQTLFTYIAFCIQNLNSKNMPLTYIVEGVNAMRRDSLSDPLKFYINTRGYNQLIFQALKSVKSFPITFLETTEKLLVGVDEKWNTYVVPAIKDIHKALQRNSAVVLPSLIQNLLSALEQHHAYELTLFNRLKAEWHKQNNIKDKLFNPQSKLPLKDYNTLRELNNLFYLSDADISQSIEYNYQKQACVHRLAASVGFEVGVNCNDSEDRTGVENVMVAASHKFMRSNSGKAPDLKNLEDLRKIKELAKAHQLKDVGIENTRANCPGAAGHQVTHSDVDGFVNTDGVTIAKMAKSAYQPLMKKHGLMARIFSVGIFGLINIFLETLFSKLRFSAQERKYCRQEDKFGDELLMPNAAKATSSALKVHQITFVANATESHFKKIDGGSEPETMPTDGFPSPEIESEFKTTQRGRKQISKVLYHTAAGLLFLGAATAGTTSAIHDSSQSLRDSNSTLFSCEAVKPVVDDESDKRLRLGPGRSRG